MSGVQPVIEGDGPWRVATLNSEYRVRRDNGQWRVQRVKGRNAPTPHTREDGVWQDAQLVEIMRNGQMLVTWDAERATLTSEVKEVTPF